MYAREQVEDLLTSLNENLGHQKPSLLEKERQKKRVQHACTRPNALVHVPVRPGTRTEEERRLR